MTRTVIPLARGLRLKKILNPIEQRAFDINEPVLLYPLPMTEEQDELIRAFLEWKLHYIVDVATAQPVQVLDSLTGGHWYKILEDDDGYWI